MFFLFQIIWFRTTNDDGRMGDFIECEEFSKGIFKMVFNTKPYFTKSNTTTFYPYVEVILYKYEKIYHYILCILIQTFLYLIIDIFRLCLRLLTPNPITTFLCCWVHMATPHIEVHEEKYKIDCLLFTLELFFILLVVPKLFLHIMH